jgi:hypothetical protein
MYTAQVFIKTTFKYFAKAQCVMPQLTPLIYLKTYFDLILCWNWICIRCVLRTVKLRKTDNTSEYQSQLYGAFHNVLRYYTHL